MKLGFKVLDTRGGYHILINPTKVKESYKNSFYKTFLKFSDQQGDLLIPVPGTYQGGYVPKFL